MRMIRLLLLALPVLAITAGLGLPQRVAADDLTGNVTLTAPVTGISIENPGPQSHDMVFKVNNSTDHQVEVGLRLLSGPDGWNASVFDRFTSVQIRRIQVPAGESADSNFRFAVPDEVAEGDYSFRVGLTDLQGNILDEVEFLIGIERDETEQADSFELNPRYTTLAGPTNSAFTYRVDLRNNSRVDRSFDLDADAPPGWQVSFKPSFEDTQIASLNVAAGEKRGLEIRVQPPGSAEPGTYPILLIAVSDGVTQAAPIQVQLTGIPKVALTTPSGRLNADATAGEESEVALVVFNSGTAGLDNVRLLANAPEEWSIRFDGSVIPRLERGEAAQITATIMPPEKTIPGDYSVTIVASSPQAQDNTEFRITVLRSTTFGWVGIAIVVLAGLGVGALFVRLGRR